MAVLCRHKFLPSVSHARYIEIFHVIFLTTGPLEFELWMTSEWCGQASAQMQSQSSPSEYETLQKANILFNCINLPVLQLLLLKNLLVKPLMHLKFAVPE